MTVNLWLVSANSSGGHNRRAQPWGTLGTRQWHTGTISTWWLLPTGTMGIPTLTRSRPDTQPACPSHAGGFPGSLGLSWDVHRSTFPAGGILVLCIFTTSQNHEAALWEQRSLPGPGCETWATTSYSQPGCNAPESGTPQRGFALPPLGMRVGGVGWWMAVRYSNCTGHCRLPEQRSCSKSLLPR